MFLAVVRFVTKLFDLTVLRRGNVYMKIMKGLYLIRCLVSIIILRQLIIFSAGAQGKKDQNR